MSPADKILSYKKSRPFFIAGLVLIAVAVIFAAGAAYAFSLRGRVVPGVKVNGISLGGMKKEEASAKLHAAATIYENNGLNFTDGQSVKNIDPVFMPGNNPDAARVIFDLDADHGLAEAYAVGRTGSPMERAKDALSAAFGGRKIYLKYAFDEAGFDSALRNAWKSQEDPVDEARLDIKLAGDEISSISVLPSSDGREFDYNRAIFDLRAKIAALDSSPVKLETARTRPAVTTSHAQAARPLVEPALSLAPLPTGIKELEEPISVRDLASMLEVYVKEDGTPSLRVSDKAGTAYLKKRAESYDISPANTRYEIDPATKKMTLFEAGKDGRKIDIAASIASLNTALRKQLAGENGKEGFALLTATEKSQVMTESAQELGIREIIGVGQSDFSGSPTNRVKNITHGSQKLNGILIAPGEEFSAITSLEPVTIEDGYFAEAIILGDKIKPDVGGGLCQIGTTLFRMAMNAGLPITERQNHSLVVSYYRDPSNGNPGTDATLFGPHPDLRFRNDTGSWMLLTTEVDLKTKKLTYTIWGTSDGRRGSYTPPKVTEWIPAPEEVRNVEDPSLKPGEQKCQNAYRGAKTYFVYTVVAADGTVTEKTFSSYYRALPKICSNGPTPPETPAAGEEIPNAANGTNVPTNGVNPPAEASSGTRS